MPMRIESGEAGLAALLCHQVHNLFMLTEAERDAIAEHLPAVLQRVERAFTASDNKYYRHDGEVYFNPWHSAQSTVFLYMFSHHVSTQGGPALRLLADKVYCLNKALNGLDLYHEIEMPAVFFLDHPVGSVLGRAVYGEGFTFSQQCTVGQNHGAYPTFGRNVTMLSGSKVIGSSTIGDNVILSANSYVKDMDVPADSIVFGQSPANVIKPRCAAAASTE